MIDFSKVIENDIELQLYENKVNEITKYLLTYGGKTFWDVVKDVGGSERRILRLLSEMEKNNLIKFDYDTSLFYIDDCNPKQKNYKCKSCGGATVELEELNDLKSKLKVIWENKPKPTLLFDQRPVTLETSLKRVAYLMSRNDVYKKDIVFLGDDDLTSICLAMANNNCKITVLDADERLIDYINQVALKYNLNVDAFVLNVMNIIPDKWHGKFDVLMTDPTPQKIPFTVFTNAAIDLLKENGVLYTSIYSSAMSKNMDLQRIITNMNLYITEMIPAFTHYQYIYEFIYYRNDSGIYALSVYI